MCVISDKSGKDYSLRLRSCLEHLPVENFVLLKYVINFLFAIAAEENYNKMGPMELAIGFGPNIFRCVLNIFSLAFCFVAHIYLNVLHQQN